MRLVAAVRRVAGLPEHAVIWNYHPGFLLWGKAIQARHNWEVDCFSLPDRNPQTGKTIYVNLRDFAKWSQEERLEIADFHLRHDIREPPSTLRTRNLKWCPVRTTAKLTQIDSKCLRKYRTLLGVRFGLSSGATTLSK